MFCACADWSFRVFLNDTKVVKKINTINIIYIYFPCVIAVHGVVPRFNDKKFPSKIIGVLFID